MLALALAPGQRRKDLLSVSRPPGAQRLAARVEIDLWLPLAPCNVHAFDLGVSPRTAPTLSSSAQPLCPLTRGCGLQEALLCPQLCISQVGSTS